MKPSIVIMSLLIAFCSGKAVARTDTLIARSSVWRYLDDGRTLGTKWQTQGFDDGNWPSCEVGMGMVDDGDEEADGAVSTYFRALFTVNDPTAYSALTLWLMREDGAVVYINGVEVCRSNMPSGNINFETFALAKVREADTKRYYPFTVPPAVLIPGTNIISVEVHRSRGNGEDVNFNLGLTGQSNRNRLMSALLPPVLSRGPYLQMVNSSAITVRWRTDIVSNSVVKYGLTTTLTDSVTDATSTTEHIVRITGLSANTKYYYSVGYTGTALQGDANNYFYTAPTVGSTQRIRIWGMGDFGNNTTKQDSVRNAYTTYTGSTYTNLWITFGDNAYNSGTDAEYSTNVFAHYTAQMKQYPMFTALGNHDYANTGYLGATALGTSAPYFSIFSLPTAGECGGVSSGTEKYYSYNYANVHFIVLDSYGALNDSGSAMWNWLVSDLSANSQQWTIVYFHHAPYTQGSHDSNTETEEVDMRTKINPILDRYNVDLVLTGHSHISERSYLMKGHYGVATTFAPSMKVSTETKDFVKYYPYPGTIHAVVGAGGQLTTTTFGGYPMPCMYYSSFALAASCVIDVSGDTLWFKYLSTNVSIPDSFRIIKVPTNNTPCQGELGPFSDTYNGGAIDITGQVWMWGINADGQLGDNTTITRSVPVRTLKGQYNGTTYLGDNSNNLPLAITGGGDVGTLPTGGSAGILAANGLVYMWGRNNNGQLGINSVTNSNTPMKVWKGQYAGTTYLGDVSTNKITALVAGGYSTIALGQDGIVYSWGGNNTGELGVNSVTQFSTPRKVLKGQYAGTTYLGDISTNKIAGIAAGEKHFLAFAVDGTVYAWGDNTGGQIGDNSITQRSTPIRVLKGLFNGTTYLGDVATNQVVQVSGGGRSSGVIMKDGTVYIWGNNNSTGRLGDGSLAPLRSTPVRVLKGGYAGTTYLGDVTTNKITLLRIGGHQSAALGVDGTVYAWGDNTYGQLGDNTLTAKSVPVRVLSGEYASTGSNIYLGDGTTNPIVDIETGEDNIVAASKNCATYAWGRNAEGQLGDNSTTNSSIPQRMQSGSGGDFGLPVELVSFTATLLGSSVALEWITASEVNSYAIEVERRIGTGGQWGRIGVLPGHGTTNTSHTYQFTDDVAALMPLSPLTIQYRLKQIDLGGAFQHSQVREVNLASLPAELFMTGNVPNPFSTSTSISFGIPDRTRVVLELYDIRGRRVGILVDEERDGGFYRQSITSDGLTSGVYRCVLRVRDKVVTREIILSK